MSMHKKIKILFFTPYAGYTGSEMMLWYLLSSLDKEKFEIKLFAGRKGELLKEFPKTVETNYARAHSNWAYRLADKLLKKLSLSGIDERQILKFHKKFSPDYWYLNTMTLHHVAEIAIKHKIKYIVHFHELLSQYASVSSFELKNMISRATYAVGCAEDVCQNLKVLGANKVHKQYECVDFSRIEVNHSLKSTIKEKHKIPPSAFVIVMSGQRIERKGFDLFVETAIRSKNTNDHFLWLGASKNSGYEFYLEQRIKDNALTNITILAPPQHEYYDHLNLADLFFLSSREDPFPLVMLEAAYLGKPILTYNSGGSNEFVSSELGIVLDEITRENTDAGILKMKKEIENQSFNATKIQEHAKQYDAKKQVLLFQNWLTDLE